MELANTYPRSRPAFPASSYYRHHYREPDTVGPFHTVVPSTSRLERIASRHSRPRARPQPSFGFAGNWAANGAILKLSPVIWGRENFEPVDAS
jgi:hypothetical protein